jgi:ribosome-binding factor A
MYSLHTPMTQKDQKIRELIRELAADFFSRESNRLSLITVTDVELRSRGATAVILVTVMPDSQEQEAIEFMHRQLTDFKEYVRTRSKMQRIPFFDVAVDKGEKNRQRLDEIAKTLPKV